jgi:hypothetical protein
LPVGLRQLPAHAPVPRRRQLPAHAFPQKLMDL